MAPLGYARVSTKGQSPDLQVEALKAAGCVEIFIDRAASGTLARRPKLDELLARAVAGDEIVVWKLDRLGRNTHNLLVLLQDMNARGVHFRSLTEGITTTGAMGTAMATVMSAFAQLERDQLSERTRAGLAAAARKGRHPGRPTITRNTKRVDQAITYRHAGLNPLEISKLLGVSKSTVYRYLEMAEEPATESTTTRGAKS
ncbi:recombinase family protein [Arthrobacter sp.]|uniref:recombinase family protein n=1 Tax=Arthrobacter sp. TaxID=1667 RepID=UPI003A923FFC